MKHLIKLDLIVKFFHPTPNSWVYGRPLQSGVRALHGTGIVQAFRQRPRRRSRIEFYKHRNRLKANFITEKDQL